MPPEESTRADLGIIDALRGLAALYVMLGHVHWLLWGGYSEAHGHGVARLLALASESLRYGHQAVLLFFLLSGFCIHYRQAEKRVTEHTVKKLLPLRDYARRRIRRLYPPLLVALCLTTVFDALGWHINPVFYAGKTQYALINTDVGNASHSLQTFIGNLLIQPGFAVPAYGTDGPLWSLAYEAWFYLLYPILLLILLRIGLRSTLLSVGFLSLISLVPQAGVATPSWGLLIISYWIVWTVGAAIAEWYVQQKQLPQRSWLLGAAGIGLCLCAVWLRVPTSLTDLCWSAALAILLMGIMLGPVKGWPLLVARYLVPLGNISYSLYVVHFPWLAFLSAWWLSTHAHLPAGAELAVPGAAGALVLAAACWYVAERPFVGRRQAARERTLERHVSEVVGASGYGRIRAAIASRTSRD